MDERLYFTFVTANGVAYRVYGPATAPSGAVEEMMEKIGRCLDGERRGHVFGSDYRLELVGPAADNPR
jgi:hypothetical protein